MRGDVRDRGSLRAGRPGPFLVSLTLLLPLACTNDGEPPRDVVQLESGAVRLPKGSRRHDIVLKGVGAQGEMTPASVDARVGDAIAFNAADGITHSVVFVAERLDETQAAFLDTTGQMRGPPLLSEGSSWIVSLAGAPTGDYAFSCALHGGQGVVHVAPAE